jgi:hypothetical protein
MHHTTKALPGDARKIKGILIQDMRDMRNMRGNLISTPS